VFATTQVKSAAFLIGSELPGNIAQSSDA